MTRATRTFVYLQCGVACLRPARVLVDRYRFLPLCEDRLRPRPYSWATVPDRMDAEYVHASTAPRQ